VLTLGNTVLRTATVAQRRDLLLLRQPWMAPLHAVEL